MKLLLDRSADALARIFEFSSKRLGANSPIQGQLVGIVPRRLGARATAIANERGALLPLLRLAVDGQAHFLQSRLSFDEGFRVARWPDMPAYVDLFAFFNMNRLNWVELPFDFAKIPTYDGGRDPDEYEKVLKCAADSAFIHLVEKHSAHFDFSLRELEQLRLFPKVAKCLGPQRAHILDFFQLWAAEVNRIEYFLTFDKTFVRFMTETVRNPFAAKPILPSQLCEKQSISFRPLQLPDGDNFYTLGEDPLRKMIEAHDRGEPPPPSHEKFQDF